MGTLFTACNSGDRGMSSTRTHYPISYDDILENILTKTVLLSHSYYFTTFWSDVSEVKRQIQTKTEDSDINCSSGINITFTTVHHYSPCLLWLFSHDSLSTPILGWGRIACFHGSASWLPKAGVFATGWLNIWMVSVPCWYARPWGILGRHLGLLKVLRPLPIRST